jgi:GxxExxY protein
MAKLLHENLSYTVRGVLFDVHNQLGPMLPEKYFQRAAAIGLEDEGVRFEVEKQFDVYYRGVPVGRYYVDMWIEDGKIILEFKVVPQLLPIHQAQAISYLKVTDADLALLVNFGAISVAINRLPNYVRDKRPLFQWKPLPPNPAWHYPELTNQLLAALHRVHFELGSGFLHQVYRRATMVELREQAINYDYIKKMPITYRSQPIGTHDVRLILVDKRVLVATIAVQAVDEVMKMQLRGRMKQLNVKVALLANFYPENLQFFMMTTAD